MSVDHPELAAAAARPRAEKTVPGLLGATVPAPRTVFVGDPEADLVEVYDQEGRRFGEADVRLVQALAAEAGQTLRQLERPS